MVAPNPFSSPQSDPVVTHTPATQPWFAVGTTKVVVMTMATLGLYTIYWFERQYRFQKRLRNESSMPLARGFFSVFFVHDLCRRVSAAAEEKGIAHSWTVSNLGGTFIAAAVAGRVLDRATSQVTSGAANIVLSLVSLGLVYGMAYPLAQVQGTINELLAREHPGFERNESYTAWNWILIVLCVGLFALGMLGFLVE